MPAPRTFGERWARIGGIAAIVAIPVSIIIGIAQCSASSSNSADPSYATRAPTSGSSATSVPPSGGYSQSIAELRHGAATMKEGESLSFTSGLVGKTVDNPDFSFPEGLHHTVSATSGAMKQIRSVAATAASCKDEFTRDVDVKASEDAVEAGNWYCLQSRSGNVAAVLVDAYDFAGTMHVQFTEWNLPAR